MIDSHSPVRMPMVGRSAELAQLRASLDGLARGRGALWLVSGTTGVGKTRLAEQLQEDAHRREFAAASGRAFAVESGTPYALFADALRPTVRNFDHDTLTALTRGVGELTALFPWLAQDEPRRAAQETADFRARLHWHFTQFLRELVARRPLVVILEDLQWADTSSLELLHFVARQMTDAPLLLYCTYNPDQHAPGPALRALDEAAQRLEHATVRRLEPLQQSDVEDLVCRAFCADAQLTRPFAALLFGWTRGNPFFLEQTLKAVIDTGDLEHIDGRWTGWQNLNRLQLPASVRDAVLRRLEGLSVPAREAAEIAAVFGTRFRLDTLAAVLGADPHATLAAVEELLRARVVEEVASANDVVYDFAHPMIRETLYGNLSQLRARMLHSIVASTLEARYGDAAALHADELAYHFARAHSDSLATKAAQYLRLAGMDALAKYANREAADYLAAALERGGDDDTETTAALAQALQRLGDYTQAGALWLRVQQRALQTGDHARAAAVARRIGLAAYWSGDLAEAMRHFDRGLEWCTDAERAPLRARLLNGKAVCLQEAGRIDDALLVAQEARAAARDVSDPAIHARVHRTLLQLHLWTGNAELARYHGALALELATASADRPLAFLANWAMGVLEAFSGNSVGVEHHLGNCTRLADELRSPVLRAWSAELALEFASARGDWDVALQIGEEAIRLARALQQRALLPRLLVWTGLIHLGRSDITRGAQHVEEAWNIACAHGSGNNVNVHVMLPACIGRAAVCLARGDYAQAIHIAEEGVDLADRAGYMLWSVHRLLPMVAEGSLWLRDLERARRTGERLRRDATRLGHRLAIAWANACDGLVAWLDGDGERGTVIIRAAVEELEAVPFIPDATRLRRQLAGRLADMGDRDGALRELRLVHDRLLQLGAVGELKKARAQFRELRARPPVRSVARERGVLTARELHVARLVAERKSSKAIARELQVSVRTVDAHLTNMFRKLHINTRVQLADLHRGGLLVQEESVST